VVKWGQAAALTSDLGVGALGAGRGLRDIASRCSQGSGLGVRGEQAGAGQGGAAATLEVLIRRDRIRRDRIDKG
jgi:hypothetical protein